MKSRILPVLLAAILMITTLAVPVSAAGSYGDVAILTGYDEVDYQADQILAEIPVAGKSTADKIQAVYDWIITHCKRNNWDGKYYYDEDAVEAASEAYGIAAEKRIRAGSAVIREDMESYWGIDTGSYSFDSNYSVAYKAKEMMLKRTGDCVNYSALFTVLLGHLGYDCRMIPGYFINPNGSKVSHKWNYVLIDGKYYWFDIRIDHSFYVRRGSKTIPHQYFMIEDTKEWQKTHDWDHTYSNKLAANAATVNALYDEAVQAALGTEPYDDVSTGSGSLQNFQKSNGYKQGQFRDVKTGAWYADNVKEAFEYGLLVGIGDGSFGVGRNLTVAQTLAIADRIHNRYYGASGDFLQRAPWYQVYVDYALQYGMIFYGEYDNPDATATRAQFAEILSRALPDEALPEINHVLDIPDISGDESYAGAVYRLYNAGILTGSDEYGTFGPDSPIKREQVAAMATRFANYNLRKQFTLASK